jgi:hypothetical protein
VSTLFPTITEKRYADYPRRYLNEYHVDSRTKMPDGKGSCATLVSARKHAVCAIDLGYCGIVRIFDRKIGQYLFTYKASGRHEGYVR